MTGISIPVQIAAGLVIGSAGSPIAAVAMVTFRQLYTPSDLQGRVNSVYRVIGRGVIPFGSVAGGGIAQAYSPRAAVITGGVGSALAVLVALPLSKSSAASEVRPVGESAVGPELRDRGDDA